MDRMSCSRCSRPAGFSLAFLVSTIGVRPRGQKCTQTVPFCKSCLRDAIPFLAATPLQDLQVPLADAYTTLGEVTTASPATAGPCPRALMDGGHHRGDAALSCGLCLIARNSRQIDERVSEHD